MILKRFASIMILVLILGIVGISGCTSSDNTTTPIYNNSTTNAQTPVTTNDSFTNSTATVGNSSPGTSDSSNAGSNVQSSAGSGAYVGNANTRVFHYSSCSYVNRMKEGNKVYFSTRDEAIAAGYRPCKVCNP